jgi:plastocyanin
VSDGDKTDLTDRTKDVLRAVLAPRWRLTAGVLVALITAVAAANGGCSSSSSNPGVTPTPTVTPTATSTATGATPTPPPQNFVSMAYAAATPTTDPTFGEVDGYGLMAAAPTASPASTPAPSQVITVTHGQTIAFVNFDGGAHTASLLIPMSGQFPSTFNNVNGASQSSPELTAITSSQFSTGNVAGGSNGHPTFSRMYTTGAVTGMFFFGDFYRYQSTPAMRTVIIVQ